MICGYKPFSFAIAIHDINYSYKLFEQCKEFTLCMPTESNVEMVFKSGTISGKNCNKFEQLNVSELKIEQAKCCGIKECKVNIFCINQSSIALGYIMQ